MIVERRWESTEWQEYALRLIRQRHLPQNVQAVPDAVRGDAGIECFTMDGCLYQCYAPEEVSDVAKAASAMKAKGQRDLRKLEKNQITISNLLNGILAKRWILLCPFLDDKEVVAAIRKKGGEIRSTGLSFLAQDFEALVQCHGDFDSEAQTLRMQSLGVPLKLLTPAEDQISARAEDDISKRLTEKLIRAFPDQENVEPQRRAYVQAHLVRENALEDLRTNHPTLWERSVKCLDTEETRLMALGSGSSLPSQQLEKSISRIEMSLKGELPGLTQSTITTIAVGTVSDWLMRCPLDFPASTKKS